jgi:transposase
MVIVLTLMVYSVAEWKLREAKRKREKYVTRLRNKFKKPT